MYGEGDYFVVDDLKVKAKEKFRLSFTNPPNNESFADTIEEVYSMNADYRGLRKLVVELISQNWRTLRSGGSPALSDELIKSIPDFSFDLCLALLKAYVKS